MKCKRHQSYKFQSGLLLQLSAGFLALAGLCFLFAGALLLMYTSDMSVIMTGNSQIIAMIIK